MKISVALCTYNGEKFLKEQLNSILNQTVIPDEIIVCDDGSKDKTWNILTEYQQKFPKIFRVFQNEKNLYVIKNFEKAINNCSEGLVLLSDQDDIWNSEKVEKIYAFFQNNKNLKAVAHDLSLLKDGNILKITNWDSLFFEPKQLQNFSIAERLLFFGNFVTGAGFAFIKTEKNIILDDFSKKHLHDRQLAIHFALQQELGIIWEPLGVYRLHDEQVVGTNPKIRKNKIEEFQIFEERNDLEKTSFYNYLLQYWKLPFKFLDTNQLNTIITKKMLFHKNKYLIKLPFLERKKTLFIWWLKNRYQTSFKDFLIR